MVSRTLVPNSVRLLCLALLVWFTPGGISSAQTQARQPLSAKPLAYLQKQLGQEPYDLLKSQPLQRRLIALLGPEYKSLVANLNPATELEEENGVLHTEGNAPHRGGEEEAILLIDIENDTIEVFLRHKETTVLAWAEHGRTVALPHEAMDRMKRWPQAAVVKALGDLQRSSARASASASGSKSAIPESTLAASAPGTASLCAPATPCYETGSFSATVNDFRTSSAGRFKVLTVNLRITSKVHRALMLGIVQGSGLGIDDRGNRYVIENVNSVHGMGVITSSSSVDTKFTLEPGESGDARIEMVLGMDHNIIYGTSFTISMTLREIESLGATQLRLGREHEIRFTQLVNGLEPRPISAPAITGNLPLTAASAPESRAAIPAATPMTDACAGTQRCYSSGPVVATIAQITASSVGNFKDHVLRLEVKFRNLSDRPIILAYASGTSTALDNLGNAYTWGHAGTHDVSAQGIGLTTSSSADPRFILQPGETRNATFQVIRYRPGNAPLGTSYTYNVTIQQLEILPSEQIRTVREYSMNFANLNAGGMPHVQEINDSVKKLTDIFGRKRKEGPW
ncbi:hypothetical protein JAO29_16580 [Edaphobacter sp. HDX4]|uniref:hypothetical protein n=1 Tax=Edaphobacter sp. HDX4 TaxID=2794064 RepID=UPI002FE5D76F